jgi:hypothetical protein
MKRLILVAFAFCVFGCNKNEVDPEVDNTVHLAGFVGTPDLGAVASYWKDGAYTALAHNDGGSQVNSLYVDGTSVFVGGYMLPPMKAVFWHDGLKTEISGGTASATLIASREGKLFGVWHDEKSHWVVLKNSKIQPMTDTALNFGPTALALSGEDMYISGAALSADNAYQYAQYWKNGELIFRESKPSNAMSVVVYNNDVYVGGYVYITGTTLAACYWKNGERVNLTDGSANAVAWCVFVTDEHVYASGAIAGQAVYWKDGVVTYLTHDNDGVLSLATCISVREPDVHAGGYDNGHPAYWKNDVKQQIANQDKPGQVKYIVVGSN